MSSKNNSLLFSIEQWEFIRRLRNSGLTKDQICQAFDDLDRIERELGERLFHNNSVTTTTTTSSSSSNTPTFTTTANENLINLFQTQFINNSDSNLFAKQFQLFMAKNIAALSYQNRLINQSSCSTTTTTTSTISSPIMTTTNNVNNKTISSSSSPMNNDNLTTTLNLYEIDDDIKELDDFRTKGDLSIHQEITHFVHKFDLKQSQIARLAGVNQAYVSKFLRGDFSDLSENGKTLIYKWYLKYSKNPYMLTKHNNNNNNNGQSYSNSNNNNNNDHLNNETINKVAKIEPIVVNGNSQFMNIISTSYEAPKRTRFSFKPDHLAILEKSFSDNPYPDPKKREELARLCNSIRHSNDISDRERVTEQIVTHWFQNKRKLTRRVNCDDSVTSNCNEQLSTSSPQQNDENNNNSCEKIIHHQKLYQNGGDSLDYDESPIDYQDFMDEAQVAAYKAIMSRMANKSPISNKSDFNDDINLNNEIS